MKDTIQFHANFYEHLPHAPKFDAESRIATECVLEHRRNHINNRKSKAESTCSNSHSNVPSKEEKILLISCSTQVTVWKHHNCSQASACRTAVRGELLRDSRWSGVKRVGNHGPEARVGNSRHPIMGFVEQDHRKGEVLITKK